MDRIEKTIGPQFGVNSLAVTFSPRKQYTKSREVFVFAAQAIAQPGTHAGSVTYLGPGLKKSKGRVVVDCLCMHGFNDTQIIHYLGCMRKEVTYPCPGFPILFKSKIRTYQGKGGLPGGHTCQPLAHPYRIRKLLAHILVE